jgi:hypothetical protein
MGQTRFWPFYQPLAFLANKPEFGVFYLVARDRDGYYHPQGMFCR